MRKGTIRPDVAFRALAQARREKKADDVTRAARSLAAVYGKCPDCGHAAHANVCEVTRGLEAELAQLRALLAGLAPLVPEAWSARISTALAAR
jgi:hypothetical protein